MPRPWSEYNARDWCRIRPVIERYKHGRYQLRMAYHVRRQPPDSAQLRELAARITGRNLLVTIAFNDADLIAWQVRLVRQHTVNCVHVIADNSTMPDMAATIAAVAADHDCPYIRLSHGQWKKLEHGGRSHGLAMTWLWRNVIQRTRPSAFGFLDHDIFPIRPTDPFAMLANYPVGGSVRSHLDRWYLWAGFCFFNFGAVCGQRLNFSTDWAAGLDTGGCNWFSLYRRLDRSRVADPGIAVEAIDPDIPLEFGRFEQIGDWLHETNFSTPLQLDPEVRRRIRARRRQLLLRRLADAGLVVPHMDAHEAP